MVAIHYKDLDSVSSKGIITRSQFNDHLARLLFTSFLLDNNFTGWHIHNGFVHCIEDKRLDTNLSIEWIDINSNLSHSPDYPDTGDHIVIISNSPTLTNEPFNMYCYKIKSKQKEMYFYCYDLEYYDTRKVIYNPDSNTFIYYNSIKNSLKNKIKKMLNIL